MKSMEPLDFFGLPRSWNTLPYKELNDCFKDKDGHDHQPKAADKLLTAYIYHKDSSVLQDKMLQQLLHRVNWILMNKSNPAQWGETLKIYFQYVVNTPDEKLTMAVEEALRKAKAFRSKQSNPLRKELESAPQLLDILLKALEAED